MRSARFVAILSLCAVLTARAQTPTPLARSVEVTVTNVDVVVTDSKGKPVTDLLASDFEVKEDGAPQSVTNLSFIQSGVPVTAPVSSTTSPGPTTVPALPAGTPAAPTTHLAVFIDEFHLTTTDKNRALKSLAEFLPKTLVTNADLQVVTWNRALRTRGSFNANASGLDDLLTALQRETASGDILIRERNALLQEINAAFNQGPSSQAQGPSINSAIRHCRLWCEQQVDYLEATLAAARTSLAQLAGLEGRKIMFLLTQKLAPSPGRELWDTIVPLLQQFQGRGRSNPEANELTWKLYDRSLSFNDLVLAANAARVSLVTIEGSGLGADSSFSAEFGGQERLDGSMAGLDSDGALLFLADQTGGAAVIGQNNLAIALERLESDWKSYYSLGFESARPKPGESRRISVTVKRPGVKVRSRRSIVERTPERKIADAVLSFIHFPKTYNPLRATLDIGKPAKSGDLFLVPIEFKLPFEKLALIPEGGMARGRILFTAAASGSDGRVSEISTQRFPIEIPQADLPSLAGKTFTYSATLKTRAGPQILSLAITDEISQQTSYVQPRTTVGETEAPKAR